MALVTKEIPKPQEAPKKQWVAFAIVTILYLAFLFWVGCWWGIIVVPFIYDVYITHKINWSWWREHPNSVVRFVMSWVDAIVFAGVAIYFLNLFFFQNFVIPSSSLEKSLLTGDYLLVSKLSYGPRIPSTPLTVPLTQHNLPTWLFRGAKSYVEWPRWDYRRVKGLGQIEQGDIVVFTYPAGDTIAEYAQNTDFYRLCYDQGRQSLQCALPTDSMPALEQRAAWARIYNEGHKIVASNPQFGEISGRPVDRRENYVKRCVGLPGQTLQIKNNIVYTDGKPMAEPTLAQYAYYVEWKNWSKLGGYNPEQLRAGGYDMNYVSELLTGDPDFLRLNGITEEDLGQVVSENVVCMPLNKGTKKVLDSHPEIAKVLEPAPALAELLYPLNKATGWSTANYGPVWIPAKGKSIDLTLDNLPIYERCIKNYEGNTLEVKDGKIIINGQPATKYTFKLDYYWMQGDNRDNSADSRFWGFVPEDHIVGKPLFVWLSTDKDYGTFSGGIRWNRCFKWVDDIK
ncbi:MAG: S26 family signal peptidase [Bacteroidales bacterium]|nr:S26 family signal peptidase [Bacteroidales bacterium]